MTRKETRWTQHHAGERLVIVVGRKTSSAAKGAAVVKVYGASDVKTAVLNGNIAEVQ